MSRTPPPKITDPAHPADDLPMQVVIPAFVISELKTGFIFGFIIYIPFIIIDIVVSSLLMSMGMMMLPPTVISLPAKVLVFILADGWHVHRRLPRRLLPHLELSPPLHREETIPASRQRLVPVNWRRPRVFPQPQHSNGIHARKELLTTMLDASN